MHWKRLEQDHDAGSIQRTVVISAKNFGTHGIQWITSNRHGWPCGKITGKKERLTLMFHVISRRLWSDIHLHEKEYDIIKSTSTDFHVCS